LCVWVYVYVCMGDFNLGLKTSNCFSSLI
jgi:hypothetical protein